MAKKIIKFIWKLSSKERNQKKKIVIEVNVPINNQKSIVSKRVSNQFLIYKLLFT